ncbi:hypothetical protein EVAR_38976_1 [Eumeta japonica]|uniref:Uncharacterized protein n=1 Tax=Eumeta variegata TaxID=151549 RepID=A0A4C1WB54_EUMVA|nr:hypothetical protein EVAR_38976_1 [Eumeta japonica]
MVWSQREKWNRIELEEWHQDHGRQRDGLISKMKEFVVCQCGRNHEAKADSFTVLEPWCVQLGYSMKMGRLNDEIAHSHKIQTRSNSIRCFVSSSELVPVARSPSITPFYRLSTPFFDQPTPPTQIYILFLLKSLAKHW